MEERDSKEEVTIIDKDESSERANGKLSFVPEDYGKKEAAPQPTRSRSKSTPVVKPDPSLPPGMAKCEFCGNIGEIESYLAPSRRFCTVTCCKRYSAEKRYYPYGRDEEGVAMSISQGLVNRHRTLRPNSKAKKQQQSIRDERRRRLAYYSTVGSTNATSTGENTNSRGRRGRRSGPMSSSARTSTGSKGSFLEPYSHPHGTPIQQWTIEDVCDFLSHLGYEAYIDKFTEHEIDGRALSLVRDHHLLMTLKLRLGPALKIIEHVNVIKTVDEMED